MVDSREATPPASSPAGLTGFRYLFAVLLLVVLATAPMVAAVAAGLTTLTPPSPEPKPFLRPAEQAVRVMEEPRSAGGVAYR